MRQHGTALTLQLTIIALLMIVICTISQQLPLTTREYKDRNTGALSTFRTVGLILHSGFDSYFAEAIQELADNLQQYPLDPKAYYKADLQAVARSFTDAKGLTRWTSELRVLRIVQL